jgi:hypothetical protein
MSAPPRRLGRGRLDRGGRFDEPEEKFFQRLGPATLVDPGTELFETPRDQDPAAMQDQEMRAEVFDQGEQVRADDDGRPRLGSSANRILTSPTKLNARPHSLDEVYG